METDAAKWTFLKRQVEQLEQQLAKYQRQTEMDAAQIVVLKEKVDSLVGLGNEMEIHCKSPMAVLRWKKATDLGYFNKENWILNPESTGPLFIRKDKFR